MLREPAALPGRIAPPPPCWTPGGAWLGGAYALHARGSGGSTPASSRQLAPALPVDVSCSLPDLCPGSRRRHLPRSREYTGAVEAKQVAQQDAERAKFIVSLAGWEGAAVLCALRCRAAASATSPCRSTALPCTALQPALPSPPSPSLVPALPQVEKAEQDKQGAIIRAQGEAQSAMLIGQAVQQNPAFLTLRKIEAAREVRGGVVAAGLGGGACIHLLVGPCNPCMHVFPNSSPRECHLCARPRPAPARPQIASTVSASANRIFLNSESLLLNLSDYTTDVKKK